jgi:hypothetical protein
MKGLKLSKTSYLILAAGVFIVVLAGLGLTRSQQMKEDTKVASDLDLTKKKLATVQTAQLSQQLESLKAEADESQARLKEAQARLKQTVVSVDVTDQFFQIAAYCSVNITNLSTTTIAQAKYQDITFSTISLRATVTGAKPDIVNFIIALDNDYVTGNVQSAQVTFAPEPGSGDNATEGEDTTGDASIGTGEATATISMLIYSYEGS